MISTFEALLVVVVALLPGATYTWAFELQAGRRGANFSDRVWRFAGSSAVFISLVLPLLYLAYRQLVVTDRLAQGSPIPWWIWTLPPAYVLLPWLIGGLTGAAVRRRRKWVRFLTGPSPSPRAWDHLFTTPGLTGWLLLKMKDSSWIAGYWGAEDDRGLALQSYASGYPDSQELYFSDTAVVDGEGAVTVDETGRPKPTGMGVLVRWEEVAYAYLGDG